MFDCWQRLAEERKRLQFNQTDFGRIGGVTKTSQVNYEAGERSPSVDYWQAIARAGVDVGYVITGIREDIKYPRECPNKNLIGEAHPLDHQQLKLMQLFDKLDEPGRSWLFGVLAEKLRMMDLENQVARLTKKRGPK